MRKTAGYTHFWQVRGQGFTDKQWRAILALTAQIIDNAAENGTVVAGPDGSGDPELGARCIDLNGRDSEMGEPFHLTKDASPAWGKCKTLHQPYDAVVVSILTAAKKVAPDILEISSDGGRDVFTRIYAMSDPNLFAKTVKLATEKPEMRPKLLPAILKHASVTKTAQRRFLVAYAHQNPEFRDELCRRLYAARGIEALEFNTDAAKTKYLKEHPGADSSAHTVKKEGPKNKDEKAESGEKSKADTKKEEGGAVAEKNLGKGAKPSQVHGNAVVHGGAKIEDNAEVGGHAVVYGNARIKDKAKVGGDSDISGSSLVAKNAEISNATIAGKARIGGSAKINGGKIDGDATIVGKAAWEGMEVSHGQWKDPKGPKAVEKNNLKDADVDEVLEKIVNKQGQMLTPAQLFQKFMREAKPETKERMKDMSIGEFMDVVKFMVDDEEAEAGMGGKTASSMKSTLTDAQLRSATIRVAHTTKDPVLRKKLAQILKDADHHDDDDGDDEKEGKFEEGSNPSDAEITKGMSPEEKKKWMANKGKVQNKGAGEKTAAQKLAAKLFPKTNVKIAEKWIQDAIKRPGRVREYLGVPEGQDIPMGKLDAAIEKVKGTGDTSLLSALILAKRLKDMNKGAAAA